MFPICKNDFECRTVKNILMLSSKFSGKILLKRKEKSRKKLTRKQIYPNLTLRLYSVLAGVFGKHSVTDWNCEHKIRQERRKYLKAASEAIKSAAAKVCTPGDTSSLTVSCEEIYLFYLADRKWCLISSFRLREALSQSSAKMMLHAESTWFCSRVFRCNRIGCVVYPARYPRGGKKTN